MCGLVGIYSSNMFNKHKGVLSNLLYLDTWRGRDSTGVAAIRHNADTQVLKSTVPGYEFVEGPALEQFLRFTDFCWIGHNRHGTIGRNIKTNAHPFTVDDEDGGCLLVGAHNGTLKNKHDLVDHAVFGTDSEALFNNIVEEGLEKTIAKVEGAWALTFYDHDEEQLKIIRNKERPLFYAFEEGRKTLIWASEMWMIRVACSRNDVKLESDKVFSFEEDTVYSFPAPMKANDVLTFERKGGVAGKQAPAFFQHWKDRPWIGGKKSEEKEQTKPLILLPPKDQNTPSGTTKAIPGESQQTPKKYSSNVESNTQSDDVVDIQSVRRYKGYRGASLTKQEIDSQLENGCSWCELEFITKEDKFAWLAPGKPVCHKCLTGVEEVSNPMVVFN